MDKLNVLITGASGGIGKACAEYLSNRGYMVYGTTRNKSLADGHDGVYELLTMDVTDQESVEKAVETILEESGGIDIVINNAGMGMAGSIEDSSYDELKAQFDTNFFGAVNVINAVLPHMRKAGSGIIVNIGSVAAYISIPYQAAYSASKAAMTSLTYSLRNEIRQFGIRTCIIHPGDLKTNFTFNRRKTHKSHGDSVYREKMERSIEVMARDEQKGGDPVIIAKAVARIIKRKNPPVSLTVGLKYKVISLLFRIVPAKLREAIIALLYA